MPVSHQHDRHPEATGLLLLVVILSALVLTLLADLVSLNSLGLVRSQMLRSSAGELASLPVNYQTLNASSIRIVAQSVGTLADGYELVSRHALVALLSIQALALLACASALAAIRARRQPRARVLSPDPIPFEAQSDASAPRLAPEPPQAASDGPPLVYPPQPTQGVDELAVLRTQAALSDIKTAARHLDRAVHDFQVSRAPSTAPSLPLTLRDVTQASAATSLVHEDLIMLDERGGAAHVAFAAVDRTLHVLEEGITRAGSLVELAEPLLDGLGARAQGLVGFYMLLQALHRRRERSP